MPQPIDPHSELGRVSAAERVQMVMERAATHAQQRSAETAGNDARQQMQQVLQPDQKQQQVEENLRRRTPHVGLRRKKAEPEEEDEAAEIYNAKQRHEHGEDGGHRLDVTL